MSQKTTYLLPNGIGVTNNIAKFTTGNLSDYVDVVDGLVFAQQYLFDLQAQYNVEEYYEYKRIKLSVVYKEIPFFICKQPMPFMSINDLLVICAISKSQVRTHITQHIVDTLIPFVYHTQKAFQEAKWAEEQAPLQTEIVPATDSDVTTMSSLEIAELTGKLHTHIMRDIRNMIEQLQKARLANPNLVWLANSSTYIDKQGKSRDCYLLDYNTTINLLTGYDAAKRMIIIQRWQELEKQVAQPINQNNYIMTKFLGSFTYIDVAKQLVSAYVIFSPLGYTDESVNQVLSTPMINQPSTHSTVLSFCNLQQIEEMIKNAPSNKYILEVIDFVNDTLKPLFKNSKPVTPPQPQLTKSSDQTTTNVPLIPFNDILQQIEKMNLPESRKQIVIADLIGKVSGLPVDMMMPVTYEEKLSPAQIAEKLGVTPQAVGRVITKLGLRGDSRYSEGRLSKSTAGNKEVTMFYYTLEAVKLIENYIQKGKNEN